MVLHKQKNKQHELLLDCLQKDRKYCQYCSIYFMKNTLCATSLILFYNRTKSGQKFNWVCLNSFYTCVQLVSSMENFLCPWKYLLFFFLTRVQTLSLKRKTAQNFELGTKSIFSRTDLSKESLLSSVHSKTGIVL